MKIVFILPTTSNENYSMINRRQIFLIKKSINVFYRLTYFFGDHFIIPTIGLQLLNIKIKNSCLIYKQ